jgi:integrase
MGLNVTRKRKRDGTVVEYFYDRETRQFLGHDRAIAEQRLSEPIRSLQPGTIAKLVAEYRSSTHYRTDLAPKTRKEYSAYLDLIVSQWGDLPVRGLKPGHIERIKSLYERTPRKANLLIAVFRIILSLAVKWEWIPSNPAARPGMIPTPPRTAVWSTIEEDRFLAAAPASIRLAFALMLYTVQRPADVLAMTRGQVTERDGRVWLRLRQQKTDELMAIPVHTRLEPLIHAHLTQTESLLLVPSPTGLPWAYRNFCRKWDGVAKHVGVSDRQRRDLRRTGIVRMAEAGATTPQIASLSGHSIDYCQRIITYLPRRAEVALSGIEAWEKAKPSNLLPIKRT